MLKKIDFKSLVIIILVGVLFITQACPRQESHTNTVTVQGKQYEVLHRSVDTVEKIVTQVIYKPGKTIYNTQIKEVKIPVNVDSTEIVKSFFAKTVYLDTITLDNKLGRIFIKDTVTENAIVDREVTTAITERTIKDSTIVKEPERLKIYIGPTLGNSFVGPNILIKSKSDKIWGASGGIGYDKNYYFQGSLNWLISLRKKGKK